MNQRHSFSRAGDLHLTPIPVSPKLLSAYVENSVRAPNTNVKHRFFVPLEGLLWVDSGPSS